MTVWDEVRELIDTGGLDELAARMARLDDAERQEVARRLPGHLGLLRREVGAFEPWEGLGQWAEHLRVAGAGSLGGAAAVATWLNRREFTIFGWETPDDTDALMTVISAREPEWQADLVNRLVLRIRNRTSPGLPLVLTLLRRTGVTPPEHDPLVVGWLAAPPSASGLRRDPLLGVLLPRIFEAQGAGRALREERSDPLRAESWLGALAVLSGEGRVSREMLLDGCVSRFLRGGDATDLRFFVRLHELLEPTYVEVESRARDYLRLLPAAPGPVAELSLRHLRRLDHLDPADVTEALESLLFRAEGGLVRAGLTWLDQTLRQSRERADELAPALASALGHDAYAVQERAARLAVKYASHLTPLGAETLRAALGTLPPDLGGLLAEAVGGEAEPEREPEVFAPPPLVPPRPAGAFPDPPGTVAELARVRSPHGWQETERWLAGFVRFAAEDREALRAAVTGSARDVRPLYQQEDWYTPRDWITAIAAELVSPGADPGPAAREVRGVRGGWSIGSVMVDVRDEDGEETSFDDLAAGAHAQVMRILAGGGGDIAEDGPMEEGGGPGDAPRGGRPDAAGFEGGFPLFAIMRGIGNPSEVTGIATAAETEDPESALFFGGLGHDGFDGHWPPEEIRPDRLPRETHVSTPHRFLLSRCAEVLAALKTDTLPPVLLATPTGATGHLDPAAFLTRLETVEATGAEPLPADFQQALLRLPGTVDPGLVARAGRLTSEAGRMAARRLAEGPVEVETRVRWEFSENARTYYADEREPYPGADLTPVPWVRAEPTGLPFVDELFGQVPSRNWGEHGRYMDWWPAVLPSHRDVVAARYLPYLLHSWNRPGVHPHHVEALASGEGQAGEPMALLLAFFLSQRDPAHGVLLLVRMAARGDLPADALGRQLALTDRSMLKLPHTVAGLEQAARQGAHREVWEVILAALPHVLPGEGERPRPGAADLVALGVEVAGWAGARGEIPGLNPPPRRSSSAFGRLRRRLHDYLVRP
ncbi:hypothetical protein ACSDR0_08805 [Streptosporangium sp. G11]|uniref:hypothetical protein n=1 Tax=Streptosporangium sp. G11 TaxID=3436926 RepID=UPI003EC12EFF